MSEHAESLSEENLDSECVRAEVLSVVTASVEVDLATIYRKLVGTFGAEAVPLVSEAIGYLLRARAIVVDTRRTAPASPLVGYARLRGAELANGVSS